MPVKAVCHCGAVEIEVAYAPPTVWDCNCSICRRLGTLWAYYQTSEVRILSDAGATELYQTGPKRLEFHSCKTCACTTHWAHVDKTHPRMGINARLMDYDVINAASIDKTGPARPAR